MRAGELRSRVLDGSYSAGRGFAGDAQVSSGEHRSRGLDASDPAAPLTMMPSLVQGLFLGSILVIQLAQTWMTKK